MDWIKTIIEPNVFVGLCATKDGLWLLMTTADGTGLDLDNKTGFQEVAVGFYENSEDGKGAECLGIEHFDTIQDAINFYEEGD